jgi:hypothetical protein
MSEDDTGIEIKPHPNTGDVPLRYKITVEEQ